MIDPVNLVLDHWVETSPLFSVFLGREIPEDLLELFVEDWISEFKDIVGHQKDVEEVKDK